MIFHKHDFKQVARTFAEPIPHEQRINGDAELIKALRFGVTEITFLCACGDYVQVESYGREDRGAMEIKFREVEKK